VYAICAVEVDDGLRTVHLRSTTCFVNETSVAVEICDDRTLPPVQPVRGQRARDGHRS
jgi:hypothetical protein